MAHAPGSRRPLTMRALAVALVVLLGCCAQPEPAPGPGTELVEVARLPVRLEFEPPLAAPGRLWIAHECGERREIATGCASVDLTLPPGPVVFVLLEGGRSHECAATVAAGMPAIVWQLGGGR